MSVPELQDYEQQTTSFDAFGWFRAGRYHLTAPGEPQFVPGAAVTPALARQLGPPLLGQWFADDSSAVISSALWRRLGGGRDIIGSAITLDERRYTVSGVMPPAFRLPIASLGRDAATPRCGFRSCRRRATRTGAADRTSRTPAANPGSRWNRRRQTSGASPPSSPRRIRSGIGSTRRTRPTCANRHPDVLRATLLILLGGAGLLLLIACANVATLLLARAVVRARETAIRVALGASRRQLALRYFAEGALVSVAGAAAGVGLSAIFVRHILAAASAFVPRADLIAHRLEGARLQRGGGGRHRRARRPGPALAGDAHGAERGALRRRSRVGRRAGATPVEGVRRRRNRPRLHAPDDVGHSRRPPAQPGPRVAGLRPRRPRHVRAHPAATRIASPADRRGAVGRARAVGRGSGGPSRRG